MIVQLRAWIVMRQRGVPTYQFFPRRGICACADAISALHQATTSQAGRQDFSECAVRRAVWCAARLND